MSEPGATPDLYSLAFDQYSRQKWAALFIDHVREGKKPLKILDVGGYKGQTAVFQKEDEVTICDLFDVEEPSYVKGDGRSLPFEDKEFDFVVTFDTYEHVIREDRQQFISELLRVAKNGVILAAPFDDENGSVFQAEVDLNDYHRKLYGKDHPWLTEHIEYRIPLKKELDNLLEKLKLPFVPMASNDLYTWVLMQTIYFSIDLDDDLRGRVDDINRYYNKELARLDSTTGPAYRQIYFISTQPELVDKISHYIAEQKNAVAEESKTHFFAYALSVWGQKYRDVEQYKNYLESEIENMKAQEPTKE